MDVKSLVGGAKLAIDVANTKKAGNYVEADEALKVLRKEARTALKESGVWKQEFHNNEIVSLIAMYKAITTTMQNGS